MSSTNKRQHDVESVDLDTKRAKHGLFEGKEFTLIEHPDMDALKWAIDHPDIAVPCKPGLRRYRDAAKDANGRVEVIYKRDGCGRFYAKSPWATTATTQSRRFRSTLFAGTTIDVDIKNCHPRLLYRLVRDCPDIGPENYQYYQEYTVNRDDVLQNRGLDKSHAKLLMNILNNGGSVERWRRDSGFGGELNPWWTACVSEVQKLIPMILDKAISATQREDINAYLSSEEYTKKHGEVSGIGPRISVLLQELEVKEILAAMNDLHGRGVRIEAYCYDGFMVNINDREIVENWISEYNTPDVEFDIKDFDPPLKKPLPSTFTLYETPNLAALEWVPCLDEVKNCRALARYREEAARNNGKVAVTYYRDFPFGRYKVNQPEMSLCVAANQQNAVRSTLFGDSCIDVDIVNCGPRMALRICQGINIDTSMYQYLKTYYENREQILKEKGLSRDNAKAFINIYLNGGGANAFVNETGYAGTIPKWWKAFGQELNALHPIIYANIPGDLKTSMQNHINVCNKEIVMHQRQRNKLSQEALNAPIPPVSDDDMRRKCVAFYIQEMETEAVVNAMEQLSLLGVPVQSYLYDGFFVHKKHQSVVETWIPTFEEKYFVRFAIKPFKARLTKPPFKSYNAMDFIDIKDDPDRMKVRIEQYMFKSINPAGIVFMYDGMATESRDPRRYKEIENNLRNLQYKYQNTFVDDKGAETVETKTETFFSWWLKQPDCRQYNALKFAPPPLPLRPGHRNTWVGTRAETLSPAKEKVDVSHFIQHVEIVAENNPDYGEYLMDVLAQRVQRPGERTGLIFVITGKQGSGKSTFFEKLFQGLFYPENVLVSNRSEQIIGKFNLLPEKVVVIWEEADSYSTQQFNNRLKHLATTTGEYSEKKGIQAQFHDLCFLPMVFCNTTDSRAVSIEKGDRRFVLFNMDNQHMQNDQYFQELYSRMDEPEYIRAIYDYLMTRDISQYKTQKDWQLKRPITDAYKETQTSSQHPFDHWLNHVATHIVSQKPVIRDYGRNGHADNGPYLPDIKLSSNEKDCVKISPDTLTKLFNKWALEHGYQHTLSSRDVGMRMSALERIPNSGISKRKINGISKYGIQGLDFVRYRLGDHAVAHTMDAHVVPNMNYEGLIINGVPLSENGEPMSF